MIPRGQSVSWVYHFNCFSLVASGFGDLAAGRGLEVADVEDRAHASWRRSEIMRVGLAVQRSMMAGGREVMVMVDG